MISFDGYRKTDAEIAFDKGIERTYHFPKPYGPKGGVAKMTFRIRFAGSENIAYQTKKAEIFSETESGSDDRNSQMMGLLYDEIILSATTDLQSGGEDLELNRENFIWLYTAKIGYEEGEIPEEIGLVLKELFHDITDRQNFVVAQREKTVKN